jgi:FKBP-type peptidyl-prolyl cis-trans isomerase 2
MKNVIAGFIGGVCLLAGPSVFAQEAVVAPGKQVSIEYTLFVNNEQIETSVGDEPLTYVVGDNTVIPGLESQLNGMKVGEEKEVTVAAKDAYGDQDPKAFKEFPKDSLPKDTEPKVGMVLQATAPDGENFPAVVSEVKDDQVVLDFNHPLAGKELKFKVKVLDVKDVTAEPESVDAVPAAEEAVEAPADAAPAAEAEVGAPSEAPVADSVPAAAESDPAKVEPVVQ